MPLKSKRSRNGLANVLKRPKNNVPYDSEDAVDCATYDFDDLETSLDEINSLVSNEKGCQKSFKRKHASTQTDDFNQTNYNTSIIYRFNLANLADLICIFFYSIPIVTAVHRRILSIIVYLLLRLFHIPFERCRIVLEHLDLVNAQTCHSWLATIVDENDICVVIRDQRGSHNHPSFYDTFRELEIEAKAYALKEACRKNCSFKVG